MYINHTCIYRYTSLILILKYYKKYKNNCSDSVMDCIDTKPVNVNVSHIGVYIFYLAFLA